MQEIAQKWSRAVNALQKQNAKKASKSEGVRYDIKDDIHGKPYVEITTDILKGVPKSKWGSVVRDNLKQKYPNGITVGNNLIEITKDSRRELTESKYTKYLRNNDETKYADKMRATDNADDILHASDDYVNEAQKHPRKDDIVDFGRGKVRMSIGGNDYIADVVVGMRKNGVMRLHDIVGMDSTTIEKRPSEPSNPEKESGRSAESFNNNIASKTDSVKLSDLNSQKRFSMSDNVERKGDLIAVHNLSGDQLLKSIERGGFPMPSIAVMKQTQGHDRYGDVSVIFGKDTIDPKKSTANKVYGGDAWTPTYPTIEYKPNEKVLEKISDKYYDLRKRFGYDVERAICNKKRKPINCSRICTIADRDPNRYWFCPS